MTTEPKDEPKPAAPDLAAIKRQARLIHAACVAVLGGAVALRYTVLKDVPDVGTVMIPFVTLVWGALGFTPPQPVLALAVAALDYKKLSQMLSLRKAVAGNALSSEPPPSLAELQPEPTELVELDPTEPTPPATLAIVPPPLGKGDDRG